MASIQRARRFVSIAALASAAALSSAASAQSNPADASLALNRFSPAPAGDRFFGVQSPYAAGAPGLHLMLLADYAKDPLVLRRESDGEKVGAVVSDQLFFHLNGSFALWNRLNLNVEVPVALVQSGEDPTTRTTAYPSPSGADFGDIRLGARVVLLGKYYDPLQLSIGGYVWLPTGSGSFTSDGELRGQPVLTLGGRTDKWVWALSGGPEIRTSQPYGPVQQGTMMSGGAGIAYLFGAKRQFQVGPEMSLATVLEDTESRNTNAEILLGGKWRFMPRWEAGLGAGPGLTSGLGSPSVRVVASLAFTPEPAKDPVDRDKDGIVDEKDACPDVPGVKSDDPKKNGCPLPPDRDKDGILDQDDACPDVPGIADADPKKNGCPPPSDRDKDGIIDDLDACPDVPGVADADPKKNGCPPDRDGDGVLDKDDACIDLPGVKTDDPKTNGCPGDTDGDGIRDDQDACPREKGKPDPDPKKNGCPQSVRVDDKEIYILQQVQFDTAKATIRKESDALLDEVAGVFKDHTEITKVEIQGHTDNRGSIQLNKKLSQDRAEAVRKALIKRGIDEKRLTAKGFGPDKPVVANDTPENLQKNRRVQFVILEKEAPKK
jgi:OOP family OmpA-OmpF porin